VPDALTPFARLVLDAVDRIPPGKVMSYGDVAELVGGGGARAVGRVMARYGSEVPWHRVLRADGSLARHLYTEQRQRLLAEGVRFDGDRVRLADHRWDGRLTG
jgi:O-6-methylguanine DNA methyltransferase